MEHWKLTQWCMYATQKIKYLPDRREVYQELRQHLDDRCQSFLDQGMSKEDAANQTVTVMGDPKELATYLAAVHPPFWGFACSITKWLCILTSAVLCLIFAAQAWRISTDASIAPPEDKNNRINPYADTVPEGYLRTLYCEPGTKYTDSGYLVELARVSCLKAKNSTVASRQTLCFQLEITSLLPWADDPDFCNYLVARDSMGNIYPFSAAWMHAGDSNRRISGKNYRTSPLTWVYDAKIYNLYPFAQWIELRYERGGREMVFRIDLTGGETG